MIRDLVASIFAIVLVVVLITVCTRGTTHPRAISPPTQTDKPPMNCFVDHKLGVACYWRGDSLVTSCVKIDLAKDPAFITPEMGQP
jgi:hypothetical protein